MRWRAAGRAPCCQTDAALTHLQVLVEQPQLAEVLEDVVLLPAAVVVLRVVASLPPAPPVPHHSVESRGQRATEALKLPGLPPHADSRQQGLLDVSTHLFSRHDDHQLGGQFNQTASWVALGQGGHNHSIRYPQAPSATAPQLAPRLGF